jgi:vang-like
MEDEVVEVEVIRQADDWGKASTVSATTASKAEGTDSASVVGRSAYFFHNADDEDLQRATEKSCVSCYRVWNLIIACSALLSPVVFVCAPLSRDWDISTFNTEESATDGLVVETAECNNECGTQLVGFGVRLVILTVGVWALLLRKPRAYGPSAHRFRSIALLLGLLVLIAYWLFFVLVLAVRKESDYNVVLGFANSLLDAELFVHYTAVVLIEIRRLRMRYNVKVTRNIDGWTRSYNVGCQSLQETAYDVLNAYYRDFPDLNASQSLTRYPSSRYYKNHVSGLKFYEIDAIGEADEGSVSISGRSRGGVSNSRRKNRRVSPENGFAEAAEQEKKVERRRVRLIAAVEDSFNLMKRTRGLGGAMGAEEAAAAIFPSMARALQKYLRATRQQSRHSAESVVNHLARCLRLDLGSRAFLQRYFSIPTCLEMQTERDESSKPQAWRLVSDASVKKTLHHGLEFQLQNQELSLVVEVIDLPELCVIKGKEEPRGFQLKVNSETTV